MAEDYLLTETEANKILAEFNELDLPRLLMKMQASENKIGFAKNLFYPLFREAMNARPKIKLPTEDQLVEAIAQLLELESDTVSSAVTTSDAAVDLNPSTSVLQQESSVKVQSLSDLVFDYGNHLNDKGSVYVNFDFFSEKAQEKIKKAIQSYAFDDKASFEGYKATPNGDLVIFMDFTALGSAKDGMYVTEHEIYIKPAWEKRTVYKLKEIQSISLNEKDCLLTINAKDHGYVHASLTPKMRIFVKCIKSYLKQFEEPTSPGDEKPILGSIFGQIQSGWLKT
jgi:hypothetical protein